MKIKINDIEVNAIVDNDIALTKSVNKMQSLSNRSGAFSTEIEAGLSSSNRQLTQNAQSIDNLGSFPYSLNKCEIEANGYNVLTGFANLEKTKETYQIRAFGELANVFELIGDAKLKDLNLDYSDGSPINHIWNYANVIANRNNTWESGFIYPNINYGKWNLNKTKGFWNDLYPSVFCKYLFLRIFNSIGYHVSGEFLTDELFEKSILPMVKIPQTPQFALDGLKTEATINQNIAPPPGFGGAIFAKSLLFNNFVLNGDNQLTNSNSTTFYSPSYYGKNKITYTINVSNVCTLNIRLVANSIGYSELKAYSLTAGANTITIDIDRTQSDLYILAGIQFASSIIGSITITGTLETEAIQAVLIEGNVIFVNECLPEVSQKDFLETIINQYNLMITIDSVSRVIDFSYFNSVYANKSNAIDWSNKLDTTELPTIEYKIDGYSQNNYLNYETDDNDIELRKSSTYGQGSLFCNNANLEKENDIFASKFAPIVRIPCLKSPVSIQAFIQLWKSEDNELTYRTQSVKPRIAYINRGETLAISGTDGEGGGGGGVSDSSPSAGVYFQDLEFAGSLIPKYYRIVSDMLQSPVFIESFFNIKVSDYNQIDFTRPIYLDTTIKGFGNIKGYFYCNEIKQFKINRYETTAIELIRI